MAYAAAGPLTIDQRNQIVGALNWASFSSSHAGEIVSTIGTINDMETLAAQGEIATGILGTIGEFSPLSRRLGLALTVLGTEILASVA